METLGKTLAVILVLAVVGVVVTFFVRNRAVVVKYDSNGFPIQPAPKEGDQFVLKADGKTYIYTSGKWIIFVPPIPIESQQTRQLNSIVPDYRNIPDYTNTPTVLGLRISQNIKCFRKLPGVECIEYIQIKENGIIYVWKLISASNTQCCYRKQAVGLHPCDLADNLLAGHGVHGSCVGKDGVTVNY